MKFVKQFENSYKWWLFFFIATWFFFLSDIDSFDLWWHMACGRFFMENGHYPPNGTFSFGEVSATIANSKTWLGDIILYLIYEYGGVVGLYIFRTIGLLLPILIMLKYAGKYNIWTLFTAIMIIVGTGQIHVIRNSFYAMYFMPLILYIWHTKNKYLFLLYPIIFYVWSHMHGYCIVGILVLCFIFTGYFIDQFRKINYTIIIILLPVLAISYILVDKQIPLGLTHIVLNFKDALTDNNISNLFRVFLVGGDTNYVSEYMSPFEAHTTLFARTIFCFGFIYTCVLIYKKSTYAELLPSLATIFLSFGYLRSTPFAYLVACPFMVANIPKLRNKYYNILPFIACILFCVITYYCQYTDQFHKFTGIVKYNVTCGLSIIHKSKIPQYVLKNYKDEKIYNSYNMGGWLLWEWYDRKKVYIDNRSINYKSEYFADWRNNKGKKYRKKYNITKAICSNIMDTNEIRYFLMNGWFVDKFDNSMCFLTRKLKYPEYIGDYKKMPYAYQYKMSMVYCDILKSLIFAGSMNMAYKFSKEKIIMVGDWVDRLKYHKTIISEIRKRFDGNHIVLGRLALELYKSKTEEDIIKAFQNCFNYIKKNGTVGTAPPNQ